MHERCISATCVRVCVHTQGNGVEAPIDDDFQARMMGAYERCGFNGERVIGLSYQVHTHTHTHTHMARPCTFCPAFFPPNLRLARYAQSRLHGTHKAAAHSKLAQIPVCVCVCVCVSYRSSPLVLLIRTRTSPLLLPPVDWCSWVWCLLWTLLDLECLRLSHAAGVVMTHVHVHTRCPPYRITHYRIIIALRYIFVRIPLVIV